MKPYRGKRTGPQLSQTVGFSFVLRGGRVVVDPIRAALHGLSAWSECTFRGENATTASWAVEALGEGSSTPCGKSVIAP